MNKLIEDAKKVYDQSNEKQKIEQQSSIRNLIVKIFGTQYLDCFTIGVHFGLVCAKINDSDLVLRADIYGKRFYMQSLVNPRLHSAYPITDLESFYKNFHMMSSEEIIKEI